MTGDDLQSFSNSWVGAWEICGKTPTPGAVSLCFRALQDFNLNDISIALTAHIRDPDIGQYPPKPADIIRHLRGGKDDRDARAMLAFVEAFTAASRIGPYESINFSDPVIHHAISGMGGWQVFCQTDLGASGEKRVFMERQFCAMYKAYMSIAPEPIPELTGIVEQKNRFMGYHDYVPLAIEYRPGQDQKRLMP